MGAGRGKRRSLRRAVAVECAVQSDVWDGAIELPASDVSNEGLWLDTAYALEPGEELVVSFTPPGAAPEEALWALAEVARVGLWRRRQDGWPTGMGLAFTYFNEVDRRFLARSLLGKPPRLPARAPRVRRGPPPLPHLRGVPPGTRARAPIALSLDDVVFEDSPFGAADVPLVLDVDFAADWTFTPVGELLTSARCPSTAQRA